MVDREARVKLVVIGVELREHVRLVLGDREVITVAAPEEGDLSGIVLHHGEAVEPQVHVLARLDRPRLIGMTRRDGGRGAGRVLCGCRRRDKCHQEPRPRPVAHNPAHDPAYDEADGSTPRPHVGQNRHSTWSSALHAGHSLTVMLCPQWGQNVIARPSGSTPPQ